MVKLSNKGKSKPSKRKTLKTKYKIVRKVAQHKKKMRKQMRKLGPKNIKPRSGQKNNMLPNSFPFKAQILQHFKNQKPVQPNVTTEPQVPAEWGLIALQNRSVYFPKDKDHLTKKYINNEAKVWEYANTIVFTVDARNVQVCLSKSIEQQCQKRGVKLVVVVCKIDTVSQKYLNKIKKDLEGRYNYCLFTTQPKRKNSLLDELLCKIKETHSGPKKLIVVGKANTGKHTLVKQLMKYAKFHNQDYSTINDVEICQGINTIDTPFRVSDDTAYPLFSCSFPLGRVDRRSSRGQSSEVPVYRQYEGAKNRNDFLMHYNIQDYISIDDLLKKIGKATRVFGKGGMVNVAAVRDFATEATGTTVNLTIYLNE